MSEKNTAVKEDKSKYRMAHALKQCMKTATVEDITVRQICEECGITRQTFYRHFQDKYDLINWYFDRLLLESFDQMGSGKTIYEGLIRKFDYIREEALFFSVGFRNDDQNSLRDHDFQMILDFYRRLIQDKTGTPVPADIDPVLEMYCQASVYMTVKWVLGNMPQSSMELADIMIDAMPAKLRELFEQLHILAE